MTLPRFAPLRSFLFTCAALVTSLCAAEEKTPACSCELVSGYIEVQTALAADDLAATRAAAKSFAKVANEDGLTPMEINAQAIAAATNLKEARAAFKKSTDDVIPLVERDESFVVMHCPMAKADWVQAKGEVRNPYFGKAMLTCGAPRKKAS
jgi:hypothetical protein